MHIPQIFYFVTQESIRILKCILLDPRIRYIYTDLPGSRSTYLQFLIGLYTKYTSILKANLWVKNMENNYSYAYIRILKGSLLQSITYQGSGHINLSTMIFTWHYPIFFWMPTNKISVFVCWIPKKNWGSVCFYGSRLVDEWVL